MTKFLHVGINALVCGVDFQTCSQLRARDIFLHRSGPQTLLLQNTGVPLIGTRYSVIWDEVFRELGQNVPRVGPKCSVSWTEVLRELDRSVS